MARNDITGRVPPRTQAVASMIRLLGQFIVPPVIAVIIRKECFTSWWEAVGVRPRWLVWILLSSGVLLFFQ